MQLTSSSAITERPRNASCLSVVSFNSTPPRPQSFIISTWASDLSLCTIKGCSVVFSVTLRLLVINTSSSSLVNNKRRRLECHQLAMLWGSCVYNTVDSKRWREILTENCDFWIPHLHLKPPLGGPRRNIAIRFSTEKLEWCGYPMVKIFWRYIYSFRQNTRTWRADRQTNGRTYGQTPHDSIGRAYE